jgi:hypothetical protein
VQGDYDGVSRWGLCCGIAGKGDQEKTKGLGFKGGMHAFGLFLFGGSRNSLATKYEKAKQGMSGKATVEGEAIGLRNSEVTSELRPPQKAKPVEAMKPPAAPPQPPQPAAPPAPVLPPPPPPPPPPDVTFKEKTHSEESVPVAGAAAKVPSSPPSIPKTGDGKTHLDLIKEGGFNLKKIPPKGDAPKPPPPPLSDPKGEDLGDILLRAERPGGNESSDDMPTPVDPEEQAETEAMIKELNAKKALEEEKQNQQQAEKALKDARTELAALPTVQRDDHTGELTDDEINNLVIPEGKEKTKFIYLDFLKQRVDSHPVVRGCMRNAVPELPEKGEDIAAGQQRKEIGIDQLKKALSGLRGEIKAKVPELKEKRGQLHKMQTQTAQAKVAFMEAKIAGGEDANAKQVEYDGLQQKMIALREEVKVLQDNIRATRECAENIIERIAPKDNVLSLEDINKRKAEIRKQITDSGSSESGEIEESANNW